MIPIPLIISGGSRGLGLVMVQRCLELGCSVASFARTSSSAVQELQQKYPEKLFFETLNSTEATAVECFVERVGKRFGEIRGLVNNAAIGQDHLLAHMELDGIDSILNVNLRAPLLLSRAVLRKMMLNPKGGRIVNITSICASRGFAALTVYSATKGGLEAFTRSLAREVGGKQILVNAIAPGFFPSAMSSSLAAQQLESIRRRTPTERLCREQDVLSLLELLLFEDNNITGQVFAVDGGAGV